MVAIPCFRCLFADPLKARACSPSECQLLDDWLLAAAATSRRGSPRSHTAEVRDLAVQLYISGPLVTLQDVACQLNGRFHFDPPLSSDSVGRWVQSKDERMKKTSDLLWIKRRKKYGKSGMRRKKRQALSNLQTRQWSDAAYKKEMTIRMSDYPPPLKQRIVTLYQAGKTPSSIRRTLMSEGIQAPAPSTIHQILNANHVPKHNNQS